MNRRNRPKAGIDSKNAPNATIKLGWCVDAAIDTYTRQEVRALLRKKAKRDIGRLRFTDGRSLTRDGRAVAENEMVGRWWPEIQKLQLPKGGYHKHQVDALLRNERVEVSAAATKTS